MQPILRNNEKKNDKERISMKLFVILQCQDNNIK